MTYIFSSTYCAVQYIKVTFDIVKFNGMCHEMVCQLWPLVVSLGLNNPPRICFTFVKSRIKNIRPSEQGDCQYQCKMAATGFDSFTSPIPQIAITWITPWQTALKCTTDCHNNKITPWQSALQFRPLTAAILGKIIFFVAFRGTIIFSVAIRGKIIFLVAICGTHLCTVCHNRVKSSHFTVPLVAAPYLLTLQCKTYTWQIV
jgi:hypothetical protein